ncbi:MAG: CorA family divalent cation transporter [Candidatus Campbellbacteria bacterium]|nr:CorA family divalent cation transporter [Candidatus Campbellbacteria bacterium]
MLHRYSHKGVTWVDSEIPSDEEINSLVEEFDLDFRLGEELSTRSFKPYMRRFNGTLYVALYFPALKHSHNDDKLQEVNFVLGGDFLITNHYDTIDPLHKLAKTFEVEEITSNEDVGENVSSVFYRIVRKLYRSVLYEIEFQRDELLEIEAHIFDGNEASAVEKLSRESLNLLVIEQTLATHKNLLEDLSVALSSFLEKDASDVSESIYSEYDKVVEKAKSNRGLVDELRKTNDALLVTKQNEVMKTFTILAFITFPLSVVAGIFGMNTESTPLVSDPNGFWYILAIMAFTGLVFYVIFRYKRWL